MKKKKTAYLVVPLILLILFVAYYWNFSSGYEQKQDQIAADARKAREDKLAEDNRLRLKAIQDAIAAQDQRKREREAKTAKQNRERKEMEDAIAAREQAETEADKYQSRALELTKEIRAEKEDIAKIEQDKKSLAGEIDFLQLNVKKAQDNTRALAAVLDKVAAADAAYAAAAAKAAAAAAAANAARNQ